MNPNLNDENLDVPLMFQAQVEGRCQLQRIEDGYSQAYDWVKQWTTEYPLPASKPSKQPSKPAPKLKSAPNNVALARHSKPALATVTKQQNPLTEPPQFGEGVTPWEYTIHWRLVTNGGQDDSIIRPVFGSKGYPYYPGSSMKGAFRRACSPEQADRYCGKKRTPEELATLGNSAAEFEPGILRFHGGYPIDTAWADPERLVDLVHSQWEKQVIEDKKTNANVQISLYQVEMKFGISSAQDLTTEWEEIKTIWEKALSHGLGSRVSAGYGYFVDRNSKTSELLHREQPLLAVKLTGQGLASSLLNKQNKAGEFRPNLFKATLRGHTLRILGGLTDEKTAIALTEMLWGGIGNEDSENSQGVEGLLGVAFDYNSKDSKLLDQFSYIPPGKNKPVLMPVYNLNTGTLKIFSMKGNISEEERQKLRNIAESLVKFSLLFGGFGKSWRRVDHRLFYPQYLNGKKPMIGCHWQFLSESESLYIPIENDFKAIAQFINTIRNNLTSWGSQYKILDNRMATNWREAWYPHRQNSGGVQVWARIATSPKHSLAVKWLHQLGNQPQDLKETSLGGGMGETGRIWHRMYPQYSINQQGDLKNTKQYVEILTIFPDDSVKCKKFIKYLSDQQSTLGQFQKVW